MKKIRRGLAAAMSVMLIIASAGCSQTGANESGKTNLVVGEWPTETTPESLERHNNLKDSFMEKYDDVNVVPDTYKFDTKTFNLKASGGQLPNLYLTPFTEIKQVVKSGYAADITEAMKKYGYDKALSPMLLEMVTDDDGKIYGVPTFAYAQGLYINKKMFKEAGLVNSDGSVMVPDTYEELAEFAKIIKEKTGEAGYCIPTTNNCGGWHFMNIAWSYGVEFMKEREDGTWEATFNSPECVAALQYIKDLKWKYDTLPDDSVIDQQGMQKKFAVGQAAMMFSAPPTIELASKYNMNIDDIFVTRMPAGEKGRFSQMGGGIWMFSGDSTEKEIDAGMRWLDFTGNGPTLSDERIANKIEGYKSTLSSNGIVLDRTAFPVWVNEDRVNKEAEIAAEYANINPADYEQYYAFEDVTIKAEEPMCCQQLYSVLDKCIQEVITNKNADCAELIKAAAEDFQVNHLDKE